MHPAISWKHSNNSAGAASVFLIYLKISAKYRTGIIDVGTPLWDWKRVRVTVPPPGRHTGTGYISYFKARFSIVEGSLSIHLAVLRNRAKETMRASRVELTLRKGLRFPLDGKNCSSTLFLRSRGGGGKVCFERNFKGNFGFYSTFIVQVELNVIQGNIEL